MFNSLIFSLQSNNSKLLKVNKGSIFDTLENKQISNKEETKKKTVLKFLYQESLRNIFTSIRFLGVNDQLKIFSISSCLPEEGKSLINVFLSKTISEMGSRVLLIDADLRKSRIHERLGINNLKGLSNILTEKDANWKDFVQNIPEYKNWSVITAGTRPPDSTRLLSSKKMNDFIIFHFIVFFFPIVTIFGTMTHISQ